MQTLRWTTLIAAGLVVFAVLPGCLNVDANVDSKGWQDVARDYKDAYASPNGHATEVTTDKQAVKIAKKRAESEGIDDDDFGKYRITVRRADEQWYVRFRLPWRTSVRWPEHFVVRVREDGKTFLYKNPNDSPG